MSLTRIFRWSCDFCQATTEQEHYGLPVGWLCINANALKGHKLRHTCPECAKGLDLSPAANGVGWIMHERVLNQYEPSMPEIEQAMKAAGEFDF